MPSCYWPGCKSRAKTLFVAPKDPDVFKLWKEVIPMSHKGEFTMKDNLCIAHFKEEDIERYYHSKGPNGEDWFLKRGKISLKKGSIPCAPFILQSVKEEFPDIKQYTPQTVHYVNSHISPKKENILQENENILQQKDKVENIPISIKIELPVSSAGCKSTNFEYLKPQQYQHKDVFSFHDLKRDRDQIIENSSWTTTVSDEFICYLYWAPNFTIQKHILIFKDFKVKVFFDGKESKMFKDATIVSLESVAIMLQIVESTNSYQEDAYL